MTTLIQKSWFAASGVAIMLAITPAQSVSASNGEADTLRAEADEAVESVAKATADERAEAADTASDVVARIDAAIDRRVDQLAREWNELSRETREERAEAIDALRKEQAELTAALDTMQAGAQEAWNDVRDGFVDAYEKMTAAWDEATETETQ